MILLLKSLGGANTPGADGRPGFLDALEILVENLRKECYSKFAYKDDINGFKKRIDALEKLTANHDNSINQCRDITDNNTIDID